MTTSSATKRRVTFDRVYKASIDKVWALWTTKDGIESWWGPEGFSVTVLKLDLRPGGRLLYAMRPSTPETIAFMKSAGMPEVTESLIKYTDVEEHKRIVYDQLADFIPGVEPYDVATEVEFTVEGPSVRMRLTVDAMHSDEWTQRATMGRESELRKLDQILGGNV